MSRPQITVDTLVDASIEAVWKAWTTPEDIMQWNAASDDWHTTHATNDLRPGGKFTAHMAAKDGSIGFDFAGVYSDVETHELIAYAMEDGRKIEIRFTEEGGKTKIVETFDAEDTNSLELQRTGWQAILDNFKKYAESR